MKLVIELDANQLPTVREALGAVQEAIDAFAKVAPGSADLRTLLIKYPERPYQILMEGADDKIPLSEVDGKLHSRVVLVHDEFNKARLGSSNVVASTDTAQMRAYSTLARIMERFDETDH